MDEGILENVGEFDRRVGNVVLGLLLAMIYDFSRCVVIVRKLLVLTYHKLMSKDLGSPLLLRLFNNELMQLPKADLKIML